MTGLLAVVGYKLSPRKEQMRGTWKDGRRKFSRDANVHWRGIDGRTSFKAEWDDWDTCGAGTKDLYGRIHNKEVRRAFKKSLPGLLDEAQYELSNPMDDSWFEPEDLLNELGLQKAHYDAFDPDYDDIDWQDVYDYPIESCMNF